MKEKLFSALAAVVLIMLGTAAAAYGQLMPGEAERASIPFDFIVRAKTLPAGDYEVRRITDSPYTLLIRNVNDNHDQIIFMVNQVQTRATLRTGEIVFKRFGDTYFLSEIWSQGEQKGDEVPAPRDERRLERDLAGNNHFPETVTLALN
jgi:hypothetical protein